VGERKEVRLSGAGNHGMIEAGLILQEAAAIYDDLNAHHVQSYGPEARGPYARSEVIIAAGDIDYPKATQLDAEVFTTQEALERYTGDLKAGGILIVDADVEVPAGMDARVFRLPILKTADETLGRPGLVHVVALGVLVALSQVVTKEAIESAVKDHVPRGGEELHLAALQAGYRLAASAQ
jgi:2-oxoglutarate ferredoxin oxidoreductase subunit gamma